MSPDAPPTLAPPTDPRLAAYLPLIYVAWADGELTDDEIRTICDRLATASDDDPPCRQALAGWLDPERPPTPSEHRRLLRRIRELAPDLPDAADLSLAELGLELAETLGHRPGERERAAIAQVQEALGLGDAEPARRILEPIRPMPEEEEAGARFDVGGLTRRLDGRHRELRQRLRRILSRPEFAYEYGLGREEQRARTLRLAKRLAEEGIGALSFPAEVGGGGDLTAFIAAFETMAFHDHSLLVKMGVQFGLFGGSILQLGTEGHHRRFLPRVATLELPGCFAMSETGHGSNVQELETVARYDAATGELVVTTPHARARKDYIGNAARDGRMATVFAQLEVEGESYGVHALLVPIRDERGEPLPGVTIEDCGEKMGLNGVDNGRLSFDGVRVPRENLLDRFASVDESGRYTSPITSASKRFFVMLGTLVGGRVSVALAGNSAAKSALAIAVRYAVRRRQFGPGGRPERALLDYPSHQRRLLPRLATTYALHFALEHLVQRYADSAGSEDRREVETLAAGLKAYSTWHATDTIQEGREACGGQGYLAENRFASLKADTDVFTTFEGDNTVLLQLVAKGLLSGYRKQFHDLTLLGLARYLAGRAAITVAELNPVVTRLRDEAHLRDRGFQTGALLWREEHLLSSLARRLKTRIDGGGDPFDALSECQTHALALAKAHVESTVLERFAAAVAGLEDAATREVLERLCDLYALSRIESDRGWFQEHGYLEGGKAKAIRDQVDRLCAEVRPQAVPLVNAFGIPPALLAAPIAL
ncbi:MAG: acyl-CoA dehydrogenase [Thermoanaerobaculia bacterium]|nr:acyl-CoA dehydrogenase [Thermoanaerobaculia bacterium]